MEIAVGNNIRELIDALEVLETEHGGGTRIGVLDTYGDTTSLVAVQHDPDAAGGPMIWLRHE